MKRLFLTFGFVTQSFVFLALTGCAPKIYVIDRQTILEEEAAGDWPQFEKELLDRSQNQGSVGFSKPQDNERKKRLFNVLNGEMVASNISSATTKNNPSPKNSSPKNSSSPNTSPTQKTLQKPIKSLKK